MKFKSGDSVSLGVPTILAICIGVLIVLVIFVIAIIKVGEFIHLYTLALLSLEKKWPKDHGHPTPDQMALKMEELKRRCNAVPEPKEERNLYYGLYYR